jgi:hypothetical protein
MDALGAHGPCLISSRDSVQQGHECMRNARRDGTGGGSHSNTTM